MKVTQTDNQIELKNSGFGQLITGVILIIVGAGMAIFLPGSTDSDGKKAPIWLVFVGVAIAIGGIIAILFAKNRSVVIQRGSNTTITAKRVIGGGPHAQTIPTANIVAVRLSTYLDNLAATDANSSQNNSRRSVLSLVLNNNDLVEVGGSSQNSGFSVNGLNVGGLIRKAPLSKEANQIASFLGVPLQADDSSSVAGAVQSVKSAFQHGNSSQPPAQPTPFNPAQQPQVLAGPPTPPAPPNNTPPLPPQPPSASMPPVPPQPAPPQNPPTPQQ